MTTDTITITTSEYLALLKVCDARERHVKNLQRICYWRHPAHPTLRDDLEDAISDIGAAVAATKKGPTK